MKRREFITLLGGVAVAWPLRHDASAQGRPVRVALIASVAPPPEILNAFRDGLRERGYVEGQNLSIDVRWSRGPFEQNPDLAAELVRGNPDVIVAWSTPAVIAARKATSTIPIVMVSISDPVDAGFIASLARPGGTITGVSNMNADLSAKLMALLVEIAPGISRVGVVLNPKNPGSVIQLPGVEAAIRALHLQSQAVEASTPAEFDRAFARLGADGANGVVFLADSSFIEHARTIAELAKKSRMPTAFQRRENIEAGGLMSYGARLDGQFRQAAVYVDRILKGTKPAELPVEQPTKFELVINLKTAKVLGLTVAPQPLADRAEGQRAGSGCTIGRLAAAGRVRHAAASSGSPDG
jgi:putative ABC transport system substrate-binding protein